MTQGDLLDTLDPILADGYPTSAIRIQHSAWRHQRGTYTAYYGVIHTEDHTALALVMSDGMHIYAHRTVSCDQARQCLADGTYTLYRGPIYAIR